MKDGEGPSTNDDDDNLSQHVQRRTVSAFNGGPISLMSNGSTFGQIKSTCRRRSASGGGGCGNNVYGGISLCCNGHLTMTPRIDLPRPTHDVTPAFDGLVAPAAEHMGGAPGEGWATIAAAVPTRSQILRDLANLCTFTGAILATLAMACMWKGKYCLGMVLNVAASLADIVDGPIARSTPGRHPAFAVVGSKLDCYSDIVSHFVVPASLLMHISDLNVFCTALAALYVCAGILRHSLFEVTGRCENGSCIYGMSSDYNVTVYVLAMHLQPVLGRSYMLLVLAACLAALSFTSLTFVLRSRRYDGLGLLAVGAYNASLCASCFALLAFHDLENFVPISAGLFVFHALLAYPCYFRFVELNV